MNIELTYEEVEVILEWYYCYENEGPTSKLDRELQKKLNKAWKDV